jgi:hypothetical protein
LSNQFTDEDIRIQQGIATDLSYPFVNYNGDVTMFYGGNQSGHPLTVIINSIVNSMYIRYAFMEITKLSLDVFDDNVHLATLGDDNIMGVSSVAAQAGFSHTGLVKFFATKNIKYTMADKTTESKPFIDIKEADFLKRKFVFNWDIKRWICPISIDTLHKMLTVITYSKNICVEEQVADIILNVKREMSLHGKQSFERYFKKLKIILEHNEVISSFVKEEFFVCGYVETLHKVLDLDYNRFDMVGRAFNQHNPSFSELPTLK